MKFKLTNSGRDNDLKENYSKLLKKYNAEVTSRKKNYFDDTVIEYSVEIEDIETLMAFIEDCGHPIVLDNEEIEIYDYWRE